MVISPIILPTENRCAIEITAGAYTEIIHPQICALVPCVSASWKTVITPQRIQRCEMDIRYYNTKAVMRERKAGQGSGKVVTHMDGKTQDESYVTMLAQHWKQTAGPKVIPHEPIEGDVTIQNSWWWSQTSEVFLTQRHKMVPPIQKMLAIHKSSGLSGTPTEYWQQGREIAPLLSAIDLRLRGNLDPYPKVNKAKMLPFAKEQNPPVAANDFRPISVKESVYKAFDTADLTIV